LKKTNEKQYIFQPKLRGADADQCQKIAAELDIPVSMAELLFQRGLTSVESAADFLDPRLSDLPSPFSLRGMEEAVQLLIEAVAQRMQVVIHGDYDADGITSSVLLTDFFNKLDLDVRYHLPNRMTDSYGLSMDSVAALAEKVTMPALLITVDCGITAVKEVAYAKELGFKVIVTDHHVPPAELPRADAVINPRQQGCDFACKELAGVGVAFFLTMAVRRRMVEKGFWDRESMPNLRNYLDLVALGTVADVMPLVKVNRILVRAGLEVVTDRTRPGIWALCERAAMGEGAVTSENISFGLAPRINAAGRVGTPQLAAELLLSRDIDHAMELANGLEEANLRRRELESAALEAAIIQAEQQVSNNMQSLVLFAADWHPGVIGIIASRMVDRFQLPALVFTIDTVSGDKIIKGSGRSVPGLNLFQALAEADDHIIQFGGHAMAAGLTVAGRDLQRFHADFDQCVRTIVRDNVRQGVLIDQVMDEDANCHELIANLQRMEPFGQGNPEPVFLLKNIQMETVAKLREHLKFSLQINGSLVSGIGFFMADSFTAASGRVDLGFKLKKTCFRGQERIEAHAVIVKATD
jgi:single-stranded-DNA-specific exonuclease